MYYIHDHLYSPVALTFWSGSVQERYEYDVYGNCYILEPNFAPDPDGQSDYGNPYLFTGRRVDILDSGSLKIQYNRNRYLEYYTGRWLTQDPAGYVDGLNLYEYVNANPVNSQDPVGLKDLDCAPCKCDPHLFDEQPTPGGRGDWDPIRAAARFMVRIGGAKIFSHDSIFSNCVANHTPFVNTTIRQALEGLEAKAKAKAADMKQLSCKAANIPGLGGPYFFQSWKLKNTLGSGNGGIGPYSCFTYRAKCCLRKWCCEQGKVDVNIKCKVLFYLADKYSLDKDPVGRKLGKPFWTIVYLYKDFGPKTVEVNCR